MLTQDFLNLQQVQLKASQEWSLQGEHLTFIFPKGGVGKWTSGGAAQRLSSGDVLVLNAVSGGKICVTSPREMSFSSFSLHLEHLFPLLVSSEICMMQNISDCFRTARLYPASSPVAQECHRRLAEIPDHKNNLDHRSRLLHVAAAVLTDEFSNGKTGRAGIARPEEHMPEVFKKLTAVELMSLSIDELAKEFGCGRRHLNRLFHHYFGISVAALQMEMRLLRSITLLRDPYPKVIRVAEDCGFNQLGLFNICFKRRFGTTPGQWRKLNLKSGLGPDHQDQVVSSCLLKINGLCPLTGHSRQDGHALPIEVPAPARAGSTRLVEAIKKTKRREFVEPSTALGLPIIRKETQRRVVVGINT
jgi:AraC-like DNA-binding protein